MAAKQQQQFLEDLEAQLKLPENKYCADCRARGNKTASSAFPLGGDLN